MQANHTQENDVVVGVSALHEVPQQYIDHTSQHIEIGLVESAIGVAVLVFSVGVAWGKLNTSINQVRTSIDEGLKPDVKDIRERFGVIEDRVDTLWKDKFAPAQSPRQLNAYGKSILEKSGIKDIVDEKRVQLLHLVKDRAPETAYDAENVIEDVMAELPTHCPDIQEQLKDGAFKTGAEIGAVLFIGSVYLRDQIFEELGYSLSDLDLH